MKRNELKLPKQNAHGVVDLFSGAGGMSFGFHKHPAFKLLAAADAEIGKPSMKAGTLRCNSTYALNMGVEPVQVDLGRIDPGELRERLGIGDRHVSVLSACAPCTGFSRANPQNHLRNDHRNNLVEQSGYFATALNADILVMENARELLSGNFACHFQTLKSHLEKHGYNVHADRHMLTRYGLPQIRERALVIAVKSHLSLKTLPELWDGFEVAGESITVRKAFSAIRPDAGNTTMYPKFSDETVLNRLAAIPKDGGSWTDLIFHRNKDALLTGAMKRRIEKNKLGSHPDVYGRMWWNRPAPTIKRECAHIGNGRYAHPEEDRLCSVREMAILQGFPNEFQFNGNSVSNNYRHIGDAVPPLISYQIACLCQWILGGEKPTPRQWVLPDTHLKVEDLIPTQQRKLLYG